MSKKIRLVICAGVSGAGKTTFASVCEEYGYYVIEDLPVSMVPSLFKLFKEKSERFAKDAIFVNIGVVSEVIALAKKEADFEVVSVGLDCAYNDLLNRFRLTRHIHPLQPKGYTLDEALRDDEAKMKEARQYFDIVIDTTGLSPKDFHKLAAYYIAGENAGKMNVVFSSFGYKYGLPRDAEVVLDARVLANPFWVPELKNLTGLDKPVQDYIDKDPKTEPFITKICGLLDDYFLASAEEGRNFLFVDIGCSGGQHRSVYVAQKLYEHYKDHYNCTVSHRELSRYQEDRKD
jgi:UPF0042 nucleotide-binding protein